jgi:hypothetical protein
MYVYKYVYLPWLSHWNANVVKSWILITGDLCVFFFLYVCIQVCVFAMVELTFFSHVLPGRPVLCVLRLTPQATIERTYIKAKEHCLSLVSATSSLAGRQSLPPPSLTPNNSAHTSSSMAHHGTPSRQPSAHPPNANSPPDVRPPNKPLPAAPNRPPPPLPQKQTSPGIDFSLLDLSFPAPSAPSMPPTVTSASLKTPTPSAPTLSLDDVFGTLSLPSAPPAPLEGFGSSIVTTPQSANNNNAFPQASAGNDLSGWVSFGDGMDGSSTPGSDFNNNSGNMGGHGNRGNAQQGFDFWDSSFASGNSFGAASHTSQTSASQVFGNGTPTNTQVNLSWSHGHMAPAAAHGAAFNSTDANSAFGGNQQHANFGNFGGNGGGNMGFGGMSNAAGHVGFGQAGFTNGNGHVSMGMGMGGFGKGAANNNNNGGFSDPFADLVAQDMTSQTTQRQGTPPPAYPCPIPIGAQGNSSHATGNPFDDD